MVIVGAGDALDAREEVSVGGDRGRFKIALRRSEADGAFSENAAMRGGHLAAAGIVGHSPVMDRAEGSEPAG